MKFLIIYFSPLHSYLVPLRPKYSPRQPILKQPQPTILQSNIGVLIYLTAIGLPPGGSSTVHIYTQTIHRTTQLTTLVGRLSGIRTHSVQTKIHDELTL
jgi:uncharacterized integral membrane protein